MQIEWPKRLAEATLPLGLPESSLPLLLGALASGNQTAIISVPGVDALILAAALEATKYSYAASFRYSIAQSRCCLVANIGCRVIFYLVAGLGGVAVVLAATTRDISQFMTQHVAVDLSEGKSSRTADKSTGEVEHIEDKES